MIKLNNNERVDIIKRTYPDAMLKEDKIVFSINDIEIQYNINNKSFYTNKILFGKIPHIMQNGKICLYGNEDVCLNDANEELSLYNITSKYIPWLITLPLNLKLLEFIFEIEFYINEYLGKNCEYGCLKKEKVFKRIKINSVAQLWESIEEMQKYLKYEIYVEGYEDYSIYLEKKDNKVLVERDVYKKARQRITGAKCNNITKKTAFIGVGSVNSYVIKYCLANGIDDIVLVDHDKFTNDNAFRFAFPYKGKKKIYAVKEFCKNLDNIKVQTYNLNINSKSDANIISNCERIIVSVDNFMSWIDIACFLEKNCLENVEIILVAINNFGENAKYVKTTSKTINDTILKFLFNSKVIERRELIGNGCGKSIAVYDEELLVKLAKEIVKDINNFEIKDEIIYVEK